MFTNNIHNACITKGSRKDDKGSQREIFATYRRSIRVIKLFKCEFVKTAVEVLIPIVTEVFIQGTK
jgi:hypothetical protein